MTDPRPIDPEGTPPVPTASDPVVPVPAEPDRGTVPEPPAEPAQTPPTTPPTEPPTAPPTAPPTEPPVAPPAPGPIDSRPEPKYGAYAPAGWQSPVPAAEPTPPPSGEVPPALQGSPWAAPVAPARAPGAPGQRQTWDVVLSIVLLAAGALFALIGVAFFLGMPAILESLYEQQSLGAYTETSRTAALDAWGAASQAIIFVIVAVLTILLLVRRRVAFYVPLIGGIVGVIIFWSLLISILSGDPALMEYYGNGSSI
jgi:Family of unknown function (DUF6264)